MIFVAKIVTVSRVRLGYPGSIFILSVRGFLRSEQYCIGGKVEKYFNILRSDISLLCSTLGYRATRVIFE